MQAAAGRGGGGGGGFGAAGMGGVQLVGANADKLDLLTTWAQLLDGPSAALQLAPMGGTGNAGVGGGSSLALPDIASS